MTIQKQGSNEIEFYRALKAVVLHLIRHDQDLYKPLLPMVEEFEAYTWRKKTLAERRDHIEEIAKALNGSSPVATYFNNYPHGYSKRLYTDLMTLLEAYRGDLSKGE